MRQTFGLSIPKPCHEKWSDFTPTQSGGFCASCSKNVIDFTHWSDQQLKDYFKQKPRNICGRFRVQQLTDYTLTQTKRPWFPSLVAFVILLLSRPAEAQLPQKPNTEQGIVTKEEPVNAYTVIDRMIVRGVVRSAEDSVGLPGVDVVRKGTNEQTTTDANGNYELKFDKPRPNDVLVFSFIGFETKEISVPTKALFETNVALSLDVAVLGEMVVTGGVVATGWYSPRGIWWKVRSWFR